MTPGGRHADGLTENALVILEDGVYLELISFIHPLGHYLPGSTEHAAREGHWWSRMREGWIDWALLDLQPVENPVEEAVEGGVYAQGQQGGRVKPDGDELKWRVTFPNVEHGRGGLPFFCKDITPRKGRVRYPFCLGLIRRLIDPKVPTDASANLKHACGATGVATVKLVAKPDSVDRLAGQFDLTLGVQGRKVSISPITYTWEAEVPLFQKSKPASIVLKGATSWEETEWVQGLGNAAAGIWQVDLNASQRAHATESMSFEGVASQARVVTIGFVEKVQT